MYRYIVWAVKDDAAARKLGTYRTKIRAEEAIEAVEDHVDYDGCEFTLTDSETGEEWMYTSDGWRKMY